jgi:type IV pilus assembly protein PilX
MNARNLGTHQRQRGAALVISLIILLVMTLIGISAMQTTTLEEKMAGNLRDRNLAFQAAESSLQDAMAWLSQQVVHVEPDSSATNGIWTIDAPGDVTNQSFDWAGKGTEYGANTAAGDIPLVLADPRYVVEEKDFVPDDLNPESRAMGRGRYYYRITSIGYGGTNTAQSVLQVTLARRFH